MDAADLKAMNKKFKALSDKDRVHLDGSILGIRTASILNLGQAILADIDESQLGVGWWVGHPGLGDKARILISDYLYQCANALEQNLMEAKVHLLETTKFNRVNKLAMSGLLVAQSDGSVNANIRPKSTVEEHLSTYLEDMHHLGFYRAVGSALDCLAAVIIGVTAAPRNLFSASWKHVERDFFKPNNDIQKDFFNDFWTKADQLKELKWALAYRNMLVHRGRLIQMNSLQFEYALDKNGQQATDNRGLPKLITKMFRHLPAEPDTSEIEVMRDDMDGLYLQEGSMTTSDGVFKSVENLVHTTCTSLLDVWSKRKIIPTSLPQPGTQWPDVNRKSKVQFDGIAPKSIPVNPKKMATSPVQVKRMGAASLDGSNKDKWKTMT